MSELNTPNRLKPTPNKLSLRTHAILSLATMAVVNISYTGINSNFNNNPNSNPNIAKAWTDAELAELNRKAHEPHTKHFESAEDEVNEALDGSYPLSRACHANDLEGQALYDALDKCGEGMNWTQEEIDYQRQMNLEGLGMLFLFFLDIVPTRPSVASLESAASRISKTPKQSATFKSATGERVTLRTKSTPAGETLEARVTKRNGQTTTKNEPINRNKNNKNNNPSNKSPREIEGVPCVASTIPNTPNNPLLASSNLNNPNSNNIDQFIQRLRSKYNLVRTAQMPIDVAMGLSETAEARSCGEIWNDIQKNSVGRKGLEKAQNQLSNLDNLLISDEILPSMGRSGEASINFKGNPNTIYKTSGGHIVVTDDIGQAILDLNRKRIKMYTDSYIKQSNKTIRTQVKLPDSINPDTHWVPTGKIYDFIDQVLN